MVVLKVFIAVILSILVGFIAPAYAQLDLNISELSELDIGGATNRSSETNPIQALLGTLYSETKSATENSTNNPNKAYLMVVSDTTWQASIMDSENDFTTIDGTKTRTLEFECTPGSFSTYSVSVQKQTEPGFLFLWLLQGGPIIDKGSTSAQYGIVSLSGECNKPG
jgi:hypothetical protein